MWGELNLGCELGACLQKILHEGFNFWGAFLLAYM